MTESHRCVSLVPLFNHLPGAEQDRIEALVRKRTYKKGELLFSPGEEPRLIIVARGALRVYQISAGGREQLLRITKPGGYEGVHALFGVVDENVFVEAMEDSLCCVLTKGDFTALLLREPAIAMKLLQINARRAAETEAQARFLTMEDVTERLATYLLDLSRKEGGLVLALPMKMKDLAAYLGTTPETVSRKFRKLEDEGVIERKGRTVRINDLPRLETYEG